MGPRGSCVDFAPELLRRGKSAYIKSSVRFDMLL
jgi:hypothetical protein